MPALIFLGPKQTARKNVQLFVRLSESFFAFQKLPLNPFPFGDVSTDSRGANDLTRQVTYRRDRQEYLNFLPIFSSMHGFIGINRFPGGDCSKDLEQFTFAAGWQKNRDGATHDVVGSETVDPFGSLVPASDDSAQSLPENRVFG